jgi:peptidoglycan hydrolase CwlO-like protein
LEYNNEAARNLEQLLESLIKMVGKANKNMDSLQKRVGQLEWLIKEQQQEHRVKDPILSYTRNPSEKQPLHF